MTMSVFNKSINKRLGKTNIVVGFTEPDVWIDTGSYVLNNIISGGYKKGVPLGKSMIIGGESGAGKSLIAASIARNAQAEGIIPIFLDTEDALDTSFLEGVGLDVSPETLVRMDIGTIDEAQKAITETIAAFDEAFEPSEKPKLLFILDSLGMLLTEKESKENDKGVMKGDMGQKAKQLKQFFRLITRKLAKTGNGLIATNHTWSGSDMFGNSITEINGGKGQIYAASIVLMVGKKELKESPMAETDGIYIRIKCIKTRFTQPFRKIELVVPYETGIDPYSGLLSPFVALGLIEKSGAWYSNPATGSRCQGEKSATPLLAEVIDANPDVRLDLPDDPEAEG